MPDPKKKPEKPTSIQQAMLQLGMMFDEIDAADKEKLTVRDRRDKIVTALFGARLIVKNVFEAESAKYWADRARTSKAS